MKLFPLTKNSIALSLVALIVIGFFVAGLFNVLDYFIIKALLLSVYSAIVIISISYALKNETKNSS
jgi:NADH:ubiquinone oxidoreductase subunit 6 (subunit J)